MIAVNLKYLRSLANESQTDFANLLQVPRTTISNYERGTAEPNIGMLQKIAQHFGISVDQLISLDLSKNHTIENQAVKILAVSTDHDFNPNIELVSTKAEAGYLAAYSNPEYIKELPKIYFPTLPHGYYRGFEINGDSMLPLVSGTIIITQYIEKLEYIKDQKTYVLVTKNEGVVYKRVKMLKEEKKLLLISDNDMYPPYKVSFEDVSEIWQHYAHLSFNDLGHSFYEQLGDKLQEMQTKIAAIHTKVCG